MLLSLRKNGLTFLFKEVSRGQKNHPRKKNKFLRTEVPRNFSDQCSLDFAYFLCLFSGRRSKSFPGNFFFLILGGFSPCELGFSRSLGKTAWVDSACADCLVFWPWVLLALQLPPSFQSLGLCPWTSICVMASWTSAWICCPQLPLHPYNPGSQS